MTPSPDGASPARLVSPLQAHLPVTLTLTSLATISDSTQEPPHCVTVARTDTKWKGSHTRSLSSRMGQLEGCCLVLLGPAHGGGLLLHDQPRKERGPGPDPWVSTPPCHLACQDLVFHNRYKLLSFCLYDFISPTMHPDSSVRPPNKPTRETMPLLSFASVALANLSV